MRRRTKIVCTMGPRLFDENLLEPLMRAGMDVARFNFSHSNHEEHLVRLKEVVRMRENLGLPIATMLDTKGPEIRTGDFEGGRVTLENGQYFTLYTDERMGTKEGCCITYKNLPKDVKAGDSILIDDGLVGMRVEEVSEEAIVCKVLNGGAVSNHKGINVPGAHLSMPFISEKDRADILFGIENHFDFIAASFTRSADDILAIRRILAEKDCHSIRIIAKIENMEGIQNLEEILRTADGIMVARGDMGVEIPFINLPQIQKMIIRKCVLAGKYVITATQMLDSMTTNIRPTRAEISDVANAVYDGTSAVMLSGESAAGMYPVESVKALRDICTAAERNEDLMLLRGASATQTDMSGFRENICEAAKTVAENVNAKAIIAESKTGAVARAMARCRPSCPIIAVVTSEQVCRKLCLSWGVSPVLGEEKQTSDEITEQAVEKAMSTGIVEKGDVVIVISSNKTVPTSGTDTLNIRIV